MQTESPLSSEEEHKLNSANLRTTIEKFRLQIQSSQETVRKRITRSIYRKMKYKGEEQIQIRIESIMVVTKLSVRRLGRMLFCMFMRFLRTTDDQKLENQDHWKQRLDPICLPIVSLLRQSQSPLLTRLTLVEFATQWESCALSIEQNIQHVGKMIIPAQLMENLVQHGIPLQTISFTNKLHCLANAYFKQWFKAENSVLPSLVISLNVDTKERMRLNHETSPMLAYCELKQRGTMSALIAALPPELQLLHDLKLLSFTEPLTDENLHEKLNELVNSINEFQLSRV